MGTGLLYRGVGQEWEIHDMDMAVTIGSRDRKRKINSKVIQGSVPDFILSYGKDVFHLLMDNA